MLREGRRKRERAKDPNTRASSMAYPFFHSNSFKHGEKSVVLESSFHSLFLSADQEQTLLAVSGTEQADVH